jgi:hypothetical protein
MGNAQERRPEKKRVIFRPDETGKEVKGKEVTGKEVRKVELETRMRVGFLLVANSTL